MSQRRGRALVVVLVLELVVGAVIWFTGMPETGAQPPPAPGSAVATKPGHEAKPDCPKPPTAWAKVKRVTHKELGDGTVVGFDGAGDGANVTVEFDSGEQTVKGKTLKSRKKGLIEDLIPIGI